MNKRQRLFSLPISVLTDTFEEEATRLKIQGYDPESRVYQQHTMYTHKIQHYKPDY